VQYSLEHDIWLTSAQEVVYGASEQRGAVRLASLLADGEKIRIGPRRLLGIQDGISTHYEVDEGGKTLARTNPKLTLYTSKRVEIRAGSWKLLEAVLQVAKSFAAAKSSDGAKGTWCAHMVPFGSDAILAYRKSETSVMLDFGTMRGISIPAIYDLTVGITAVWHVSIQQLEDRDADRLLLTRTIAKVTAADAEGQTRLLSLDGMLYESLGATSQLIKATIWTSNEQALVPADMAQFTMTRHGMARVGSTALGISDPISQLRKMDEDQLATAYAPFAAKRANRMATLHTEIL